MKTSKKALPGPTTVPTELLCDVLHYLPPRDLGICILVCKRWKNVVVGANNTILPKASNSWFVERRKKAKKKYRERGARIACVLIWAIFFLCSVLQLALHGFQTLVEYLANGRSSKYLFMFLFFGLVIWYFILLIVLEVMHSKIRGITSIPMLLIIPYVITHDTQIITIFFGGEFYDYIINFVFLMGFSGCCCCFCFPIFSKDLSFEQIVGAYGARFFFLYIFDLIVQLIWHACSIDHIHCYNCTEAPHMASCRKYEDPSNFPSDFNDTLWLFYLNWYWVPWVVIGSLTLICIGILTITDLISYAVIPKIINV